MKLSIEARLPAVILRGAPDMWGMSLFAAHMEQLLEGARTAAGGETGSMTVLIGPDNGIRMIADSDWPLDSLALERGAKSAFRVIRERNGRVRVEGREGSRRCVMESLSPAGTARLLLGP